MNKLKLKMSSKYREQVKVNAYLNHKFMIFYDLVNDSKFEAV